MFCQAQYMGVDQFSGYSACENDVCINPLSTSAKTTQQWKTDLTLFASEIKRMLHIGIVALIIPES